jgi:acyl carrier protein
MTNPNQDKQALLRWLIARCEIKQTQAQPEKLSIAQAGIDSLEIVSISMDLEDQFGFRIDLSNLTADTTLEEVIAKLLPAE